ncbi:MAG: iron-containing redox enzyme family protein [Candidatus Rokubacteria bacterium]|nr:iron-containing redox enzyme family protein [Candidatus Rokubacteria bacterium]
MALTAREFGESLMAEVRARRSFGGHALWFKIQEGRLSRKGLQEFAKQFFLQVVEFPRAVSALHSRCPDLEERRKLAESVYEEETGKLSGSKAHPELFLDFAAGVGLRREEVLQAEPLPSTAALIHWFEYSTKILPFLEGVAAINLAAEGQVVGAFGPFARALQKHYGLSETEVAFWDVHELADAEHSDVGDHIVVKHATTEERQEGIRRAVRTSLGMWWQFFEGMDEQASRLILTT